ncbi:MAG TPA: choice-of-anchor Q domain-containing protein, partial [Solirubrobacteraceae bacterium]|nr:choice-of-anchor Q domain-containing protein [Solirubrobacteraceae bacterium]
MGLICRALIVAGIAFAVLGGVIAGSAEAAPTVTLYVDNTNAQAVDTDNDCQTQSTPCATISYAVSLANVMQSTATTIDVLAGAYDEAVTITDEPSSSTLTITGGPGVTVTAPVGDSVFTATSTIFPTGKITLSDLTITGAQASGNGGGLEDASAGVNLMNDTFSNDSASSGGALDTQGGNKIVGDTFVGDSAGNDGGAISNNGNITATNDTFIGDTAGRDGGAISTDTGAVIENDTFSGDSAASGGALYNEFDITIAADIFDDGSSTGANCDDEPINGGSGVTDVGYNLADNSDCMSTGKHDIVNAPETGTGGINLDALGSNGGPTQTMALGTGSAAIDYIPISTALCPSTDQRGFLRPDEGESACDVGAYESGSGPAVTLTVVSAGSGSGTVTSSPAGIDCRPTCSRSFSEGTVVTLTASPAAGSTFTGWSGGGCSGTGACQVTVSAAESVTATFDTVPPVTLTVGTAGSGSGSVTTSPAGIDCGLTCSASFGEGTVVTLTATPAAGSTFTGWSGGGCSGTGGCQVTMSAAESVTATFDTVPPVTLTVGTAGS